MEERLKVDAFLRSLPLKLRDPRIILFERNDLIFAGLEERMSSKLNDLNTVLTSCSLKLNDLDMIDSM